MGMGGGGGGAGLEAQHVYHVMPTFLRRLVTTLSFWVHVCSSKHHSNMPFSIESWLYGLGTLTAYLHLLDVFLRSSLGFDSKASQKTSTRKF